MQLNYQSGYASGIQMILFGKQQSNVINGVLREIYMFNNKRYIKTVWHVIKYKKNNVKLRVKNIYEHRNTSFATLV